MAKKRFSFRLQKVLEHRDSLKKDEERNLATKHAELHVAEVREEEILFEQDNLQMPDDDIVTMAELALIGDYAASLQDALEEQRKLVEDATAAVDEAREVYIARAQEAESIEAIRDRKREEWVVQKRRDEKKEIDEMVVLRHRLRKKKGGTDE